MSTQKFPPGWDEHREVLAHYENQSEDGSPAKRNRWILWTACVGLLLSCFSGSPATGSPARASAKPRHAPPDTTAEEQSLARTRDSYAADYEKAKTPEQKAALAAKLLAASKRARTGSADRFVLAKLARDAAAQAGDVILTLQAVDAMAQEFEIDGPRMKAELLPEMAKAARQPAQKKALAAAGIAAAEWEVARDDYASAEKMLELASAAARELQDGALVQQLAIRREAVRELASLYPVIAATRGVLEKNPKDPAANLAVGSFLCLWKGDWEAGLPMLAVSSDPALQSLAQRELKAADSAQARAALADDWWDLAARSDAIARKQLQVHAGHWYRAALPGLSDGATKTRAQKRAAEAAGLAAGLPMAAKTPAAVSLPEPSGKSEPGKRGRLGRKARYESMLGMYLEGTKPAPFVNLNVPNGSNILTTDITTLLRGKVNVAQVGYLGLAQFEIPADGTYQVEHRFNKLLINQRDMGLARGAGSVTLRKGLYELRVQESHAGLKTASIRIKNKATGEAVPLFNFGGDIEKFLRQTVGPWKVVEVAPWEAKEPGGSR